MMSDNPAHSTKDVRRWPEGVGMVYLAMSPWDSMWKNRHQLMSRFATEMPVLYVEPWQRLKRLRRDFPGVMPFLRSGKDANVTEISPNLCVFQSPPSLAVSGSILLERMTKIRWLNGVRKAADGMGITRPILWLSLPEMRFAVDKFGEAMSIYHVVDEYAGYTGQDESKREALWAEEQQLLDLADLTIVVSPELASSKSANGRSVHIVENAVDFQAFEHAMKVAHLPEELREIPQPRLGYCGLIGKRLDLELLLTMGRQHPEWSIVLVGKVDDRGCREKIDALEEMANVHFIGRQDVKDVPRFISGFDIGLLPYELNIETNNISPLKLFEYIAVGKPAVSTDIPAARRHNSVVLVSGGRAEFIQNCAATLARAPDEPQINSLLDYAAVNTWDKRIDQISDLLVGRL